MIQFQAEFQAETYTKQFPFQPAYNIVNADGVEIVRDPEGFGECLGCGQGTDWFVVAGNARYCSWGCINRALMKGIERAKLRDSKVTLADMQAAYDEARKGADSPSAGWWNGRLYVAKSKTPDKSRQPVANATKGRKPCGGCPGTGQ